MGKTRKKIAQLPRLKEATIISIDVETRDPDLKEKGPGVRRDDSYLIGLGVAVPGKSWYFPFAHESGNLYTKKQVMSWAKKELTREGQPKTGAGLLYDLDWLQASGVNVSGPFLDIQVAEPLIDENRYSFSLENLAKDYLKEGKRVNKIKEYCEERKWKKDPRSHLWKIPGTLVGDYGKGDVELPIRILNKQVKLLRKNNLYDHFKNIECKLLELLLFMRKTGVPVNVEKAEKLLRKFKLRRKSIFKKLGTDQIWVADEVAKILDKHGVKYNMTPKTNKPSITKPWLEVQKDPICKEIIEARKLDKFVGTFLEGQVLGLQTNGRVHPLFHAMKHDEGGTVSGRFSCSNPNLQFTPNKKADPVMGPMVRSIFEAFPGEYWGRHDYSQVELRILAHYASGPGAKEIRSEYVKNKGTDYHDWMVKKTGKDRKATKAITFGINYGMGLKALAVRLNLPKKEAEKFLKDYFTKVPFVETTLKSVGKVAARRGYIKTILGRRRNFPFWEPADYNLAFKIEWSRDKQKVIEQVKAAYMDYKAFGLSKRPKMGVKRSKTYKALNALIQGSAADVIKKAMVDIWNSGIFNEVTPLLTMHDELGISYPKTKIGKEVFSEVERLMENTIKFKVPILVTSEKGPNWGEVK